MAISATATFKASLAAEIQRQASMVGYVNAFHLMTLVPLLTASLAFLWSPGIRASGKAAVTSRR